jgi:hypothetical protein
MCVLRVSTVTTLPTRNTLDSSVSGVFGENSDARARGGAPVTIGNRPAIDEKGAGGARTPFDFSALLSCTDRRDAQQCI